MYRTKEAFGKVDRSIYIPEVLTNKGWKALTLASFDSETSAVKFLNGWHDIFNKDLSKTVRIKKEVSIEEYHIYYWEYDNE